MAKRVPKASKRRLVFLTPFILFITVYFLFTVGYYGFKLVSLKNQEYKLSNDLLILQEEEKNLKTEIQKLKDPEYLARYAREHFLYSKDGEYVIKLSESEQEKTDNLQLYMEKYIWILIGVLSLAIGFIIIAVFKKNQRKSLSDKR